MGHTDTHTMKLFLLAALLPLALSRPRFLVIPLDDLEDSELMSALSSFPVYRNPGLARQARAAQEEDDYQSAPQYYEPRDTQASGSNSYAAPRRRAPTMWTTAPTRGGTAPSAGTPTTPCSSPQATRPLRQRGTSIKYYQPLQPPKILDTRF